MGGSWWLPPMRRMITNQGQQRVGRGPHWFLPDGIQAGPGIATVLAKLHVQVFFHHQRLPRGSVDQAVGSIQQASLLIMFQVQQEWAHGSV